MNTCDPAIDHHDSSVSTSDCDTLEEIFVGLESVISDINRFLGDYCEKLQSFTPERQAVEDLAYESAGLAEEQVHWEAKRSQVEHSIREQVDLLAEAWLRLEAEQRSLLQMKEGLASRSEKIPAELSGGMGPRQIPVVAATKPQPQHIAFHEFERLRQEIQSSRPRNRAMKD